MRNAAVHLDDDLAFEPARKPKAARPRGGVSKRAAKAKKPKVKRPWARYAAVTLSASLTIGIMVNALVLQHSRHPAPLFGKAIQLGGEPAPGVASAAAASSDGARSDGARSPIEQTASIPQAAAVAPQAATPSRPRHPAVDSAAPAPKARQEDAIAKLLLKTAAAPSPSDKKESGKTVLATQHALIKLGFVVKPTGTFGPATRSAIEAFERDQHLPAKGDMSRKVLKQLAAKSGVAIN